jgi:predicted AlkP superfamily phosphohydrolase/phosphomutase
MVFSDRASRLPRDGDIYPAALGSEVARWVAESDERYPKTDDYKTVGNAWRSRINGVVATEQLASGDHDLVMVYLRRIDLVSHPYWKYIDTANFPPIPASEQATFENVVYDAYRMSDQVLGDLMEAAPADAHIIVVSDHGFGPADEETLKPQISLDPLLSRAGLLVLDADGEVDEQASVAWVAGSRDPNRRKRVKVAANGREAHIAATKAALVNITYEGTGKPVFSFEDPTGDEDADLIVMVSKNNVSRKLVDGDEDVSEAVTKMTVRNGNHTHEPPGLFVAGGPGVIAHAKVDASIFDIAPTVLHLLDLPYGEDMVGRPIDGLLSEAWLAEHPVSSKPTWETKTQVAAPRATASEDDEALLEELRALGYIE